MAIAKLSIDLEARLAGLQQGLDKAVRLAEKDSQRIERAFARTGSALAGIGAALAGAFSGAVVTQWVRSSIDAADAAAKQARTVGLLTEEITALNYAAKLSGVNQEELTGALVRLSRTASDADKGVKLAAESFERLGIKVRGTDGAIKSSSQLLSEISDRFAQLPDGVEKTAIATELFGRSGAKLISLLNGGSEGLRQMREEAEALGLVIGTDMAKASEKLNDNIARLQKNLTGLGNVIAANVLPYLNATIDRVLAAQKTFDGFGEFLRISISAKRFDDAGAGVDFYTGRVAELRQELERLKASGGLLDSLKISGTQKDLADAQKLLEFWQRVASAGGTLGAGGGRGSIVPPAAVQPVTSLATPAGKPDKPAKFKPTDFSDLGSGFGADVGFSALDALDAAYKKQQDALEELKRAGRETLEATRTPAERLNIELARQQELLDALGPSYFDTYERATNAAQDAYEQTQNVSESLKEADKFANDLGLTFTSALEDAIVAGKSLREVIQGLADDILRLVTRELVTKPLSDSIVGLLKGVTGGGGGGGSAGSGITGFLSSLFGGFFADGGFLPPGRWGIAGERGPEPIFGGRTGVTVQSAGSGGMRVVQNFHISGGADRSTQQQIAAAAARGLQLAAARNN